MQKRLKLIILASSKVHKRPKAGQNTQHFYNYYFIIIDWNSKTPRKLFGPVENFFGPVTGAGPGSWEMLV